MSFSKNQDTLTHEVNLYSEYFDKVGSSNQWGFLRGIDMPLDKVHKFTYQLLQAVRSLHSIGKVCHYIHPDYICLTPDFGLHLILPFFEDYFLDIDSYINNPNISPHSLCHFAPEILTCRDRDPTIYAGKVEAKPKGGKSSLSFIDNLESISSVPVLDINDQSRFKGNSDHINQTFVTSGVKFRSKFFNILKYQGEDNDQDA